MDFRFNFIPIFFYLLSFSSPVAAGNPNGGSSATGYDQIIFVDDLNSLNELFAQFHGEVIYIDVWASFCKSSLEELKYRTELQNFFRLNRIVSVYISMDGPRQRDKWQELVHENSLKGYHISMANNGNISKDILNLLSNEKGGMDMDIPRYLILDRSGKVVVRRAPSPKESRKLVEQLSLYLK